jgi:hypothetical protein
MDQNLSNSCLEIELAGYGITSNELKTILENKIPLDNSNDIVLEVRRREDGYRSIDPTILVAIIGGAGAALGTFISGLLKISEIRKGHKIIIQDKNGARLEVPADTPIEKIYELIKLLKNMENPRILI